MFVITRFVKYKAIYEKEPRYVFFFLHTIILGHFKVKDGREADGDLNLRALLCKSSYSYAN